MENIRRLPMMGFGESVKTVLSKLTDFKGRARRSELWWYFMLYAITAFVINMALPGMQEVKSVVSVILLLTLLSVTVRRLHDRGHGGWWVAASIIIGMAGNVCFWTKGYMDAMQTVNPDPDVVSKIAADPLVMAVGLMSFIVNTSILVFCVLDGKPQDNKYGTSPKYIASEKYKED